MWWLILLTWAVLGVIGYLRYLTDGGLLKTILLDLPVCIAMGPVAIYLIQKTKGEK